MSAIGKIFVSTLALAAGIALAARSSPAEDAGLVLTVHTTLFDEPICEPPISTCGFRPAIDLSAPEIWPFPPPDDCPLGYGCTCVPSCPVCADCAAQVCVHNPIRECRTACDCPAGLGCFEGQCLAGFAPVYCCDTDACPAGEQCQHRDGAMDHCEPLDPMCQERAERISRVVEMLVERGSRCHTDRDCVRIDTGTECAGTCGAWVNRRLAPYIEKRIRRLDHRICSDFLEDGCPHVTPLCLPTGDACVENRCVGLAVALPFPLPLDSTPSGDGR